MLIFDVLTFSSDLALLKLKWRLMITARYIFSSISVTIGIMIMVAFYLGEHLNFNLWHARWTYLMVVYIFQGYIVWMVINLLMYF